MFLKFLGKYKDFGQLLSRLGIGFMYICVHGFPKLMGGPETWVRLGKAMPAIPHVPVVFWGFMAGWSEFFGGICLVLGLLFRPACVFLMMVMAVAAHKEYTGVLFDAAWPLENGLFLLGLLFIGPGKYSIDAKLGKT